MKLLQLVVSAFVLGAAGCGGVKVSSGSADAGPTDHTDDDEPDAGGTDGDGDGGGGGTGRCVLGTSQLGSCNL